MRSAVRRELGFSITYSSTEIGCSLSQKLLATVIFRLFQLANLSSHRNRHRDPLITTEIAMEIAIEEEDDEEERRRGELLVSARERSSAGSWRQEEECRRRKEKNT